MWEIVMSSYLRSCGLLTPEQSLVLLIDVQEKLLTGMPDPELLVHRCRMLLKVARLLNVPVLTTEQYPKGLGATDSRLKEFAQDPIPKMRFSSVEALQLPAAGDRTDQRTKAILIGMETHVCVWQTAADLLALGYEVIIPTDAVQCRNDSDHQAALMRFRDQGITISSVETVIFEWCETAEHDQFKAISRIVTGRDEQT